jgi:salicylate hydroxylase
MEARAVAPSRSVMIAGAGIGGLTAALALAQHGFSVAIFDQAQKLEEIGAGVQLSPNASRILIGLGLEKQLQRHVVAPEELRVLDAPTARVLVRAPLGAAAEQRYGAPYWVIHRGDLQAVLIEAVRAQPGIAFHLGTRVEDFASDANGITISTRSAQHDFEDGGVALIAADGLWSTLRGSLGHRREPRFARHSAWRAVAPAEALGPELRVPAINLWLGSRAHLVNYPVRGGKLVNIVAIIRDEWREAGWSASGERAEILARFASSVWSAAARAIVAAPRDWQKWALFDAAPLAYWGKGAVTLLGDAAHPMLPYLAQGAAMAIEDAVVLAQRLAEMRADPAGAMRRYEAERRSRTARAQHAARRNGSVYQLGGPAGALRNIALTAMGGKRLLERYDWLYGWTPA